MCVNESLGIPQEDTSILWIDIAKTVCIIGVVLQHVKGYAYSNDKIFYSVWLNITMAGSIAICSPEPPL